MYRVSAIFFLQCFIVLLCSAQHDDIREEINKIIKYDTEISYKDTPGFVVGIVDGSDRYYFDFGSDSRKGINKLDEESVFEIGSCTKLFTAAILEDFIIKNELSNDDLVNSFLDKKYYNPHLSDLSISDLSYHKSPFPKRPNTIGKKEKDPQDPYAFFTKEDLLSYYKQFVPREGAKEQYSHCNYALLELIIESVAKKDFSEILDEYTKKWGLSHTRLNDQDTLSLGFDRAGRMIKGRSYASFAGSEGIRSSLVDLCDYVQLHWGKEKANKAISNTLIVRGPSSFDKKIKIAKAWHVIEKGGESHIYGHTGTTSGHKAYIFMVPSTKTAVVLLANSSLGTEDLAVLVLRMINNGWDRKLP